MTENTEYKIEITMEKSIGGTFGKPSTAELNIRLDAESEKALHQWMAEGCNGALIVTTEGLRFNPCKGKREPKIQADEPYIFGNDNKKKP